MTYTALFVASCAGALGLSAYIRWWLGFEDWKTEAAWTVFGAVAAVLMVAL